MNRNHTGSSLYCGSALRQTYLFVAGGSAITLLFRGEIRSNFCIMCWWSRLSGAPR